MTGGTISGNNANNGGGIYVQTRFDMLGGAISGNQALTNGGGVCLGAAAQVPRFRIVTGTISGNTAPSGAAIFATTLVQRGTYSNPEDVNTWTGVDFLAAPPTGTPGTLYENTVRMENGLLK